MERRNRMTSASALDQGRTIQLSKKDGRYYAAVDGLAAFGVGDAYDTAIADLERRFGELQSFCEKSGLAVETLAPGRKQSAWRWGPALRRAAIVFVCIALLTVPISYALSSALERAAKELHLRGGAEFWRGIQQSLIKSAGDGNAESAEEQAKSVAALRVIVARFQPYADEIRPIFGCPRAQ
jgi:hypothetical protein